MYSREGKRKISHSAGKLGKSLHYKFPNQVFSKKSFPHIPTVFPLKIQILVPTKSAQYDARRNRVNTSRSNTRIKQIEETEPYTGLDPVGESKPTVDMGYHHQLL